MNIYIIFYHLCAHLTKGSPAGGQRLFPIQICMLNAYAYHKNDMYGTCSC
jgi:hypothetical protein